MNKLIAIIYPYDQETDVEKHLSGRVQVEKFVNPASIDAYRYDKILMVGQKHFFSKATLDKVSILSNKYSSLFKWLSPDSVGEAAFILHSLEHASSLGAFQSVGSSELKLEDGLKFTILFESKSSVFSEWRMKVKKGGSGLASFTIFDADLGKLLRSYDIHLSEFTDGWYSFKIPNPIFKAQNKKFAVSFHVKNIVGDSPIWIAHQGWSEHKMLVNNSKSDFVCCFETL